MAFSSEALNWITGACTLVLAILAVINEDNKTHWFAFLKRLWVKFPIVILASFVIIWANQKKDANSETASNIQKLQFQHDQDKRDSVNKDFTDSSNRRIASTFINAFAKYGLKYDSATKKVVSQTDKLKNTSDQIFDTTSMLAKIQRNLLEINQRMSLLQQEQSDKLTNTARPEIKYSGNDKGGGDFILKLHNNSKYPINLVNISALELHGASERQAQLTGDASRVEKSLVSNMILAPGDEKVFDTPNVGFVVSDSGEFPEQHLVYKIYLPYSSYHVYIFYIRKWGRIVCTGIQETKS